MSAAVTAGGTRAWPASRRSCARRRVFLACVASPAGTRRSAAAGRVGRALRIVRTLDRDLSDVRIEDEARNRARRVHRPLERPVQLGARQVVGREEGHADGVQARLDRMRGVQLAVARRVRDLLVPVEQLHALAVDRDFELLARDLPSTAWK